MNFTRNTKKHFGFFLLLTIFALSLAAFPDSINAQTESLDEMKAKVAQFLKQDNLIDALPLLEKIAVAEPKDADTQFYLGFALMGKSVNVKDKAERKQLRLRARNAFVKSKELGNTENVVLAFIESIPPDGGDAKGFSEIEEANVAMDEGEKAFAAGKIDEALTLYQKAIKLDPKIYEAALFSGDMYFRKDDYPNAETWYQKAITIDPDRETAYRYSATPLMKQKKTDQARDRYIEAFIVEPYSRFAMQGMMQWGQATNTKLGHPRIDVPEFKIGADGKTTSTINVNPLADDGSLAWISYTNTRSDWQKTKFAKTFPAEKTYRHSLQEEAEALRSVVKMANDLKGKSKTTNPQFETLAKLDKEGLLEAFILMAMPDEGIAQDHPAYLKQNRDKLRQYVIKYVIGAK